MDVQQAIAEFLQHGQAVRNLSDRTLRAYSSDFSQFHVHLAGTHMVDVTTEHLESYLVKLGIEHYPYTSIRRTAAPLKAFSRLPGERRILGESPPRRLKIKPPVESPVPTVLSSR